MGREWGGAVLLRRCIAVLLHLWLLLLAASCTGPFLLPGLAWRPPMVCLLRCLPAQVAAVPAAPCAADCLPSALPGGQLLAAAPAGRLVGIVGICAAHRPCVSHPCAVQSLRCVVLRMPAICLMLHGKHCAAWAHLCSADWVTQSALPKDDPCWPSHPLLYAVWRANLPPRPCQLSSGALPLEPSTALP